MYVAADSASPSPPSVVTAAGSTSSVTGQLAVSIAGSSRALRVASPGSITASFMSLGAASSVATRTWTWSTSPTRSGSVPGRECAASSLSGSGPWSSWYSTSVQSDQVAAVRGARLHGDVVVGDRAAVLPR